MLGVLTQLQNKFAAPPTTFLITPYHPSHRHPHTLHPYPITRP